MSNGIWIEGNLTDEPTLGYSDNGTAYCRFTVVDSPGKDKTATFWETTAFGSVGQHLAQSASKRTRVEVRGRVESEQWTDKHDQKRTTQKVLADSVSISLRFDSAQVVSER